MHSEDFVFLVPKTYTKTQDEAVKGPALESTLEFLLDSLRAERLPIFGKEELYRRDLVLRAAFYQIRTDQCLGNIHNFELTSQCDSSKLVNTVQNVPPIQILKRRRDLSSGDSSDNEG